jgi:hypothetical protein
MPNQSPKIDTAHLKPMGRLGKQTERDSGTFKAHPVTEHQRIFRAFPYIVEDLALMG